MNEIAPIITTLKEAPLILKGLLRQIPAPLLKQRRIPGKWTIHEHVCHLDVVQDMILERFRVFKEQEYPEFQAYMPGKNVSDAELINMDLGQSINAFGQKRARLLELISTFDESTWKKEASHPRYGEFTPYIFLRHVMMHDHFHMYRIEALWITRDEYL